MKEIDNQIFHNKGDEDSEEEKLGEHNKSQEKPDESERKFEFHKDFVLCINFHPENSSIFCTGCGDALCAIWDIKKDVPQLVLKGHTDSVSMANFNYDGKLVGTGSLDGSVRIWDSQTGINKFILEGPSDEIRVFFLKKMFLKLFSLLTGTKKVTQL